MLALVALFNPGLAFRGHVLGGYDAFVYFAPLRAYFAHAVAEGRLPLWNPHLFLGVPFLANPQTAIFYPGTWLFALVDVPRAFALNYLGHLAILAVGMYAFARAALGLGPLGSALGGAAFAFGGFMAGHAGHINQVSVAAWLPAVALALDLVLRRGSLAAFAALVAGLALQAFAGHPQHVYMTLVALGLLVLWRRAPDGVGATLVGLLTLGGATGLALGIAAVQLLPTAELSRLSIRGGGLSYQIAAFEALPWPLLLPALLPGYWSHLPTTEFFGHVGAILLGVAWLGLTFGARRPAALATLYVVLGLLLAVGDATPLYRLLFDWAPGFSSFRVPARWLLLATFGIAILVAAGADRLARARSGAEAPVAGIAALRAAARAAGPVRLLLFGAGVPLALLALARYGDRQSRWLLLIWGGLLVGTALLALLATARPRLRAPVLAVLVVAGLGEAWLAGAGLEHRNTIPNVAYGRPGEATAALLEKPGLDGAYRTLSIATPEYVHRDTPAIEERYAHLSRLALENLFVAIKWNDTLWPNVPLVYRLSSADGYDGGVLPLRRYVDLTGAMLGADRVRPDGVLASRLDAMPEARWLDLLGVRYVLASKAKDASREVIELDRAVTATLRPGERLALGRLPRGELTRLLLLSSYAGGPAPPGGEIGRLELDAGDGRVATLPVRDGLETAAATARDRPDCPLERVEPWHAAGPDGPADWLAEIRFGRQPVERLAIVNTTPGLTLTVRALNLVDDVREMAFPITPDERIEKTELFDLKLYDRLDALPRAYLVGDARVADDAAALGVMADPSFDPRRVVLLPPESASTGFRPADGPIGAATFDEAGAERVRVRVRADAAGYLVLSDSHFPGWQASVDGAPAPLLRANVLFRAVPVPAGEHVVELRYEPASVRIGALVSAGSVLAALVVVVAARARRRRRLAPERPDGVR